MGRKTNVDRAIRRLRQIEVPQSRGHAITWVCYQTCGDSECDGSVSQSVDLIDWLMTNC
jgi:hypothetical protein